MAKSESYWKRRAEERLVASERTSKTYMKQVKEVYTSAMRNIVDNVKSLYSSYFDKGEFNRELLNRKIPNGELDKFIKSVKTAGLDLPEEYQRQLSRLERLYAQMWFEASRAAQQEEAITTEVYRQVYQEAYRRTAYDLSRGLNAPMAFSTLDTTTVNKVLETKFHDKNYSERIWDNEEVFSDKLQNILAVAVASGQGVQKTARQIRQQCKTRQYYAERLVRTETNYFHNQAELDMYEDVGIKEYKILATLDNRTSDICKTMDGKKYKIKDAKAGINYPPLHVNCRSTTIAVVDGFEPSERLAKDSETGEYSYVDGNTNYDKWAESIGLETTRERRTANNTTSVQTNKKNYVETDKVVAKKIGVSQAYWNNQMEKGERSFCRRYTKDHNIKWIDRRSRIDMETGRILQTNDYLDVLEKVEYELKSITSKPRYSSISRTISTAAKSGYKQNFMIDLGQYKLTNRLSDKLSEYNLRHPHSQIKKLKVWSQNVEYKIVLKKIK